MSTWKRIPASIESEQDRRALVGILTQAGLETRIVRVTEKPKSAAKRYVEYREQKPPKLQTPM